MITTETARRPGPGTGPDWTVADIDTLRRVESRVLWLATYTVHHANHVRPGADGLKVGGHQASSASVVTIMTALFGAFLRAGDRIAVKPHASPVFHAIQYLRGRCSEELLRGFRARGGLQAYPSRTKDPDGVDYSTGSVGLGGVAALFGGLTARYVQDHGGAGASRRYVSLVGDAELDEGNVWEAVGEVYTQHLGNVLWIVDLNRQSLDRVVPDGKAERIRQMFRANGWHVIDLKYGAALHEAFARPGGERLRQQIDEMPNVIYQALLRRPGKEIRARLAERDASLGDLLAGDSDAEVAALLRNLGGHDMASVLAALHEADAVRDRPTVIVAYTIKGWRLPFEGDPLNHSMLLTPEQIERLRGELGIPAGAEFPAFEEGSPEWACLHREDTGAAVAPDLPAPPASLGETYPAAMSTQEALARVLAGIARQPIGDHVVTTSPDVAISTHLAGWVNRRGVYMPGGAAGDVLEADPRPVRWRESPAGQHIELGICENNLFLLLTALGLAGEMEGRRLIPVGTVYDPFVCRGLDALLYAVYSGARFILVGTPSGVSLAPEGGAHQSSITASIGMEVPGLDSFEPTFAREVEWILLDALDRLRGPGPALGVYLRLSTAPVDQRLFPEGRAGLREEVLGGAYRLVDAREEPEYEPEENVVHLFAMGVVVPEAIAASQALAGRGIRANVFSVTAPGRLYAGFARARRRLAAGGRAEDGPLEQLLEPRERRAPVITVADAHSHALAYLGAALGGRTIALGVDTFGESGTRRELYEKMQIDRDSIAREAEAALVELDSDG
jgi:pyruvate dehydrogenase E1 component